MDGMDRIREKRSIWKQKKFWRNTQVLEHLMNAMKDTRTSQVSLIWKSRYGDREQLANGSLKERGILRPFIQWLNKEGSKIEYILFIRMVSRSLSKNRLQNQLLNTT